MPDPTGARGRAPRLLGAVLGRREPILNGKLQCPGARDSVEIRRDTWGVPHIRCSDTGDAWYALGFSEAQDRSFQLELLLRLGRGTLAGLIGNKGLAADRLMRRIGFRRAAVEQLDVLDPDIQAAFEAFARGVNDGNAVGRKSRAHEFVLLASQPSAWDDVDSVIVSKLVGFMLSSSWWSKLARFEMLERDGARAVADLEPEYAAHHPVNMPPGEGAGALLRALSDEITAVEALIGSGGASNNWAIGPARTTAGAPIVANDPHLNPAVPSHWYLADIETPSWRVAGAAFVGAPGIVAGHNGTAAWGVTTGQADLTDLYIEEITEDGRVREGDELVPCETVTETIDVRFSRPVSETIFITPRGPVVTPALDADGLAQVSLRSGWLQPRPLRGFLDAPGATSFESFRRPFEAWPSSSINVVYGDVAGEIGWQLVGEVPRRRGGTTLFPRSAGDPAGAWDDEPIPFDEMPFFRGGGDAVIATGNNRPVPVGQGPDLGEDWSPGFRAARMYEKLLAGHDWEIDSSARLQMDDITLAWRDVRDVMVAAAEGVHETEAMQAAACLLRDWDGAVSPESPAAALFELIVAELSADITRQRAPRSWKRASGASFHELVPNTPLAIRRLDHTFELLRTQPDGWFRAGWPAQVATVFERVLGVLSEQAGNRCEDWAWGRLRPLTFKHPLGIGPLSRVFDLGPIPWGGDNTTLSMCTPAPFDPFANPIMCSTMRMTVQAGRWDAARFVLPGGQSGNPCSPHYADQLAIWRSGGGIPIPWSASRVERATRAELRIEPRASADSASEGK